MLQLPKEEARMTTPPDLPAPVAVVGSVYALYWAGSGPIAPIIEANDIKVGDGLYCAQQIKQLLADERRKALHEAETRLRQRLDAAKQTHNVSGASYSEGMRDAYDVAVLDIGSMIDKEPTK